MARFKCQHCRRVQVEKFGIYNHCFGGVELSYEEDLLVISVKGGAKKTRRKRKEMEEAFARYVREELQPEDLDDEGLPLQRCRAMFDSANRATYRRFIVNKEIWEG